MIQVQHIAKTYEGERVLQGVSVMLEENQTLSILGKSGSGKTTLLKILAGLVAPDSGSFTVHGENMFALSARERGVVYLSQEPLLFPHLNVYENLAYGLKIRKAEGIKEKVEALAEKLELTEQLKKNPVQLSGGQSQRVNFGRALIIDPKILLLDEPFGSLDTETRGEMQQLFDTVRKSIGITALFVTHDLKEALLMGDELALMTQGMLKQYETREEFINDPLTGVTSEMSFWNKLRGQ
jgi:putrescine transport system ATP-binding protein